MDIWYYDGIDEKTWMGIMAKNGIKLLVLCKSSLNELKNMVLYKIRNASYKL